MPYDLQILGDRSVLDQRSSAISVPTLVIGGEMSPKALHDAVAAVAKALPKGQGRFLPGQDHNLSTRILAPVLFEYFGAPQSGLLPERRAESLVSDRQ